MLWYNGKNGEGFLAVFRFWELWGAVGAGRGKPGVRDGWSDLVGANMGALLGAIWTQKLPLPRLLFTLLQVLYFWSEEYRAGGAVKREYSLRRLTPPPV